MRVSVKALAVVLHVAIAPIVLAATPRITFERILPAPHHVDREDMAVAQAIGDGGR